MLFVHQKIMPKKLPSKFEQHVIKCCKKKRIEKEISQKELAYLLNVSIGFIGKIENPEYRAKYILNHLNKLAKILETLSKRFLT